MLSCSRRLKGRTRTTTFIFADAPLDTGAGLPPGLIHGVGLDGVWKDVDRPRLGERHKPSPDLDKAFRALEGE